MVLEAGCSLGYKVSNPFFDMANRLLQAGGQFAASRGVGLSKMAQFPVAMAADTVSTSVSLLLNHLLAQQRNVSERLKSEAGKVVVFQVTPLSLGFRITDQGYFQVSRQGGAVRAPADTTITLQWPDLIGAVASPTSVGRKANIEGDLDLAQVVSNVILDLHWDPEHDLARVIGDAQAVWIMNSLTAAGTSLKDVFARLKANLREYAVFEKGLTPTHTEFDRFRQEVGALRDELARLEKRAQKLDERHGLEAKRNLPAQGEAQ